VNTPGLSKQLNFKRKGLITYAHSAQGCLDVAAVGNSFDLMQQVLSSELISTHFFILFHELVVKINTYKFRSLKLGACEQQKDRFDLAKAFRKTISSSCSQ